MRLCVDPMRPTPAPLAACLTIALLVALTWPAQAIDPPADVTITVTAAPKVAANHEPFSWALTLTWDEVEALDAEPDALDLLAHLADTRASTYTATWYDLDGDGQTETAFVDEVNGVHTDFTLIVAGYFWALYENGASSAVGINQIALAPGDHIHLEYTGYPIDA